MGLFKRKRKKPKPKPKGPGIMDILTAVRTILANVKSGALFTWETAQAIGTLIVWVATRAASGTVPVPAPSNPGAPELKLETALTDEQAIAHLEALASCSDPDAEVQKAIAIPWGALLKWLISLLAKQAGFPFPV